MTTLTDRQERFVHEYLIDQNASAAARRAGYSPRTNGAQAAELMKNPLVRERIREGLREMFAALRITAFNLLRAQARAAFFDPGKLFDATGQPIPLHALDEDTAAVLQVSYTERADGDYVRRVRQPPRHTALAALERRYAQFMEMELELITAAAQAPCDPPEPEEAADDAAEVAAREVADVAAREAAKEAAPASAPSPTPPAPREAARPIHAHAPVAAARPEPVPAFVRLHDPNLLWHGAAHPAPAAPPAPTPAPGVMVRPGLMMPADAQSGGPRQPRPAREVAPRAMPGQALEAA